MLHNFIQVKYFLTPKMYVIMRELILTAALMFSVFISAVSAQGATGKTIGNNTPENTLEANKNHPAFSSPAAKQPVAKKEPRRAKTSSPEIEIKQPAKK